MTIIDAELEALALSRAFTLLAAAVDPKATKARLDNLLLQIDAVVKAQAKLDADRAEHDRAVAFEKASADEHEKRNRAREVSVAIAERNLAEREQALIAKLNESRPPRYPYDPNISGTLTREPYTDA
jgi:hypothetical protein